MMKKESANKARDYITNKLLSVFTIAFAMIIGFMSISRMMRRTDTFRAAFEGIQVFAWIMLGITAIASITAIVMHIRGIGNKYRLLSAQNIAIICGFITLCYGALAMAFGDNMLRVLYVFVPTVAALYILFHTYQRDFFVIATVSGFGAIGIWLMGRALRGGPGASKIWILIGLMFALLAIIAVITIVIQANHGKISEKSKISLLGADTKYGLLYVTYVVVATLIALTWIMAGAMLYYFIFALLGYLVFVGIFYTIKLL